MTWTCAHCGLTCGEYAGGLGVITDVHGTIRVCHPNDPSRPDCYRRVTVYGEQIGALTAVGSKPPGVTGIIGGRDPLAELVRLGEEMGLYEATADACVCVTHSRFIPCRKRDGCVMSQDPEDVARVSAYQRGS